jgi:hypothetical protein
MDGLFWSGMLSAVSLAAALLIIGSWLFSHERRIRALEAKGANDDERKPD